MELLQARCPGAEDELVFALGWDEVGDLFDRAGNGCNGKFRYYALLRVLSTLKDQPMWHLFTSTNSRINDFVPAPASEFRYERTSRRIGTIPSFRSLQIPNAFVTFFPNSADDESSWNTYNVRDWAYIHQRPRHGRPLWRALIDLGHTQLKTFAHNKLFNYKTGSELLKSPKDDHTLNIQAFTIMSTLVNLEHNTLHELSFKMMLTAVAKHLRPITHLDVTHRRVRTTQWSEPLLAQVIIEATFLKEEGDAKCKFDIALDRLTQHVLSPGLVQTGAVGELITRILLMRARIEFSISKQWFTLEEYFEKLLGNGRVQWIDELPDQ